MCKMKNLRFIIYRDNMDGTKDVEDIIEIPMFTNSGNIRSKAIAERIAFIDHLYSDDPDINIQIQFVGKQ